LIDFFHVWGFIDFFQVWGFTEYEANCIVHNMGIDTTECFQLGATSTDFEATGDIGKIPGLSYLKKKYLKRLHYKLNGIKSKLNVNVIKEISSTCQHELEKNYKSSTNTFKTHRHAIHVAITRR
jgi:hypothetical protein